jgi:amino acid transporter
MNKEKKLAGGSLGAIESTIMGIAGSAPAYSVEITTSTLILVAGLLSPASILVCGIIMFGIAFAFINLNKVSPSAGTAYTWVSMVFGKTWGFLAGWALLVLCCIFMVSAMIPAANATLLIFKPDLVNNVNWVTGIAAIWLTIISAIVMKGVKITSRAQILMTIIEAIILLAIIIMSFIVFTKNPVNVFSIDWFNFFNFSPKTFADSALVAIFFYYGWDVTMNLSEETKDSNKTPGKATFWSMVFLILFFLTFVCIVLMGLTASEIEHYNTNIIFALAEKLFGTTWGYVAIIAVLLSTIGTVETQIVQFTRTLFAKSRAGVIHERYSNLHPTWQTPHIAIFLIWLAGMLLLLVSSRLPTINTILENSISALGFQICFYLGLTGLACAWYFRNIITGNLWQAITHIIWPALSGIFLFFIALYSIPTFDTMTTIVGIGGIAIGLIPILLSKIITGKNSTKSKNNPN